MPREKITLTLDSGKLRELRRLVGVRSLSAAVDSAVLAYLGRLRHLASVDEWLVELERSHGPVPRETLDWAAKLVDEWESGRATCPGGRADAILAFACRGFNVGPSLFLLVLPFLNSTTGIFSFSAKL